MSQTFIGIAGARIPVEDFRSLDDRIRDEMARLREKITAGSPAADDNEKQIMDELDAWFKALLQENEDPAIQYLNKNFGGPEGVENFLFGFSQNSYSTFNSFFREYVGIKPGLPTATLRSNDVVVNFEPVKTGERLHARSIAKSFQLNMTDEHVAAGELSKQDMLCIDQEFLQVRTVTDAKTGDVAYAGAYKITARTNSQQLAKDFFTDYCTRELEKLEAIAPDLKKLAAEEKAMAAPRKSFSLVGGVGRFFSQPPQAAKIKSEAKIARDQLVAKNPEILFLWEAIATAKKNIPASKKFPGILQVMSAIPPGGDATSAFRPANLYLAVLETKRWASYCVEMISDLYSKESLGDADSQEKFLAMQQKAEEFLSVKWNYANAEPDAIQASLKSVMESMREFEGYKKEIQDLASAPTLRGPGR